MNSLTIDDVLEHYRWCTAMCNEEAIADTILFINAFADTPDEKDRLAKMLRAYVGPGRKQVGNRHVAWGAVYDAGKRLGKSERQIARVWKRIVNLAGGEKGIFDWNDVSGQVISCLQKGVRRGKPS